MFRRPHGGRQSEGARQRGLRRSRVEVRLHIRYVFHRFIDRIAVLIVINSAEKK